jgi:hypothetical protein
MKKLVPSIPRADLMNIDAGIYEFNTEDSKDFFVNNHMLKILGSVNKIFNSSIFEAMGRILHPDDLENAFKGYQYQLKYPYHLYTNFKRMRTDEEEYNWILSVTGVLELNKEGQPVKFRGVSVLVDTVNESSEELVSLYKKAGIVHTEDDFNNQLHENTSSFLNNYFSSSHPVIPIDLLKEIRHGLNCPPYYSNKAIFKLIQEFIKSSKKDEQIPENNSTITSF